MVMDLGDMEKNNSPILLDFLQVRIPRCFKGHLTTSMHTLKRLEYEPKSGEIPDELFISMSLNHGCW